MDETKYVTLEMFEKYHEKLMEYIGIHDDLILNGITTCPKCGAKYKWDLFKTEAVEEEKPDRALRIGGATTVFYNKKIKYKKHYKCNKCGFIKVEEE